MVIVTRFTKTQRDSALLDIHFIASLLVFLALKAFFCNNIKSILQSDSQLQALKARYAIHGFVCISMAIKVTRI